MRILKEEMSVKDAMKEFGIDSLPSGEELKSLHKQLVLVNHPDRGGSLLRMQSINAAYDVLKKHTGGSKSTFVAPDWETIRKNKVERNKRQWPIMKDLFDKNFDKEAFLKYIQNFITNETLILDSKDVPPKNEYAWESADVYRNTVTIHNKDNTVVFELIVWINYEEPRGGGLTSSNFDEKELLYHVDIHTEFYYNKRKAKLSSRNYQWNIGYKRLFDIEELLPAAKIKKAMSSTTKKLFRKADMLLGLERELNAKIESNGIFLYVFGKDEKFYIVLQRSTMMGGNYSFTNVYGIHPSNHKYKSYRFGNKMSIFISETEENLTKMSIAINSIVKEVQKRKMNLVENYDIICNLFEKALEATFPKDY